MRAKPPRLNLLLIAGIRNSAPLLGYLQLAVKVGLNFPGLESPHQPSLSVILCLPLCVLFLNKLKIEAPGQGCSHNDSF